VQLSASESALRSAKRSGRKCSVSISIGGLGGPGPTARPTATKCI
jgi:hypothetical protein